MFCHFQNTSLINLVKISSCIFILFILHIVYMYTHKLNTHIDIYNYLHMQKTQLLKSFQQFLDVQRAITYSQKISWEETENITFVLPNSRSGKIPKLIITSVRIASL